MGDLPSLPRGDRHLSGEGAFSLALSPTIESIEKPSLAAFLVTVVMVFWVWRGRGELPWCTDMSVTRVMSPC